ncbi:MAG: glycosyltransferase family 4 protein [Ignavibacteriae bacterium]|nr:glycosyltransferase family 4 protein [Ignavibacteriota bacterium]
MIKKTIIHIVGASTYDGTFIFALHLSKILKSYNHKIFNQVIGSAQDQALQLGYNLLFSTITNKIIRVIKYIHFLIQIKKEENQNIIFHYHSGSLFLLLYTVLISRSKLIITLHCKNVHCKNSKYISLFRKFIYKFIFSQSKLITVSHAAYDEIHYIFPQFEIQIIQNYISFDITSTRTDYQLLFGYLGQISSSKGIEDILKFASYFEPKKSKIVVMGDVKEKIYKEKIRILNNKIEYFYPNLDKTIFFKKIDFLLFPSKSQYESFGLVILEAILNYKPVICYKTASNLELLTEEYPLFVNDFLTHTIIQKVNNFLQNEDEKEKLFKIYNELKTIVAKKEFQKNYEVIFQKVK